MPLPKGYTLDAPAQGLPAGYTLDSRDYSANPHGEGVYRMGSPEGRGKFVQVPYSSVQDAMADGYKFQDGATGARYRKDAGSAPGLVRSFVDSTGLVDVVRHPFDTAATVVDAGRRVFTPGQPERMADNPNPIIAGIGRQVDGSRAAVKQGVQDFQKTGFSRTTLRDFVDAVPVVGPGFAAAQAEYEGGNTRGAIGTMLGTAAGLLAPELMGEARAALPGAARDAGAYLQDAGAARMDRFLNGGKKLPLDEVGNPEYNAPGRTVLEQGPRTSIATSRPELQQQIAAARVAVGPQVADAYANSAGRVPLADLRNAVDSTVGPMKSVANGPGGNPAVAAKLDQLRRSFRPLLDMNGTTSPGAVHQVIQNLDKNINWSRDPDELVATVRNASRQTRGKLRTVLNQHAPEGVAPSAEYSNLSDALELGDPHQGQRVFKGGLVPTLSSATAAALAGEATHNPFASAAAAAGTLGVPFATRHAGPQTTLATGMYQAGRAVDAFGRKAGSMNYAVTRGGGPASLGPAAAALAVDASKAPTLQPDANEGEAPHAEPDDLNQQGHSGTSPVTTVRPTQGEHAWMLNGADNLSAAGVHDEMISSLVNTREGKMLLLDAAEAQPGTPRMRGVMKRLRALA